MPACLLQQTILTSAYKIPLTEVTVEDDPEIEQIKIEEVPAEHSDTEESDGDDYHSVMKTLNKR